MIHEPNMGRRADGSGAEVGATPGTGDGDDAATLGPPVASDVGEAAGVAGDGAEDGAPSEVQAAATKARVRGRRRRGTA
jgi:hypothetical protein